MTLNFHTLEALRSLLSSRAQIAPAKIALAQLFSFIFAKMNEAGFIAMQGKIICQF
jgi:hypothetical protein